MSIYNAALEKFGLEKQTVKCVEELSELQKELCKFNLGQGDRNNLIEEMADVEIMLEQMKLGLEIGFFDLNAIKNKKLTRLRVRLGLSKENLSRTEVEQKCIQCGYHVMSGTELQALGGEDPCDTCHDLSNWKPKE